MLERQDLRVCWQVDKGDKQLYEMFDTMQAIQQRLLLPEYSISQVSLEQVFNAFAAEEEVSLASYHHQHLSVPVNIDISTSAIVTVNEVGTSSHLTTPPLVSNDVNAENSVSNELSVANPITRQQ